MKFMLRKFLLQTKSNRKLFFSVLFTYILLLVVTLSLLVIGYSYSIQRTKQDMESLQISHLSLICRELDTRLRAVSQISNFLASSPLTQQVSEIDDEKAEYQLDYRALNEVIREQNAIIAWQGESFVYFKTSDSILTGEYRYRSSNVDAFTRQMGLSKEEFLDFISPPSITGSLHILHPGTENAELIYLVSILDHNYQTVGAVVTRLSMEYLKSSLNVDTWLDGSICHMQNGEDYIYIDDGGIGNKVSAADFPDYSEVPLDASTVETRIQNTRYMTVGLHSTVNDWKYYFSIPLAEFHRANRIFIFIFIVVLILSLLSGLFLSLSFSRRFSRPIQEILSNLNPDTAMNFPEAMHTLERAMKTYQRELTDTRSQLHQRNWQGREEFLYEVCIGQKNSDQIKKGLEEYQISLKGAPMFLIQFWYFGVEQSAFSQNGILDLDLLLYASCNVIEELLCSEGGAVFSHGGLTTCLCQSFLPEETEKLQNKLEKIRQFHKEAFRVDLHIFCTGIAQGFVDLPEMMSRLKEMVRYKVFWANDVTDTLFYEEINDLSNLGGSTDYLGIEKRFINLLAIKNYEEAHELLVKQLDSGISKNMQWFKIERFRIFGMISSLLETMTLEMNGQEQEEIRSFLHDLLTEPSLTGLKKKTERLFQLIIEHREQKHHADVPGWVQDIRKYIDEHYNDFQLDVSFLAREFSINVSYLSRTYKKITSIGVLDNIHMVRITKAKELLSQHISVQDTAAQVGYQEPWALIRAFKRYEGITPGQYQEVVLKQQIQ